MRLQGQQSTPSRLWGPAWLAPWVMTRLPGTTDESAFLQGRFPNCVFSPDLPGEYARAMNGTRPGHVGHLPNQRANSSERDIAFSLVMRSQIL